MNLVDQFYPNPFRTRQAAPAGPPVLPDEERTILGSLLEGSLGGLSYIGKILDKTFGGRAVRGGVLGGNPRELLSVLPFSDSLGITREADTVHGRDLLERGGYLTPGDDSTENLLAGVGAEIALDPAMWVGAAVPRHVLGGLGAIGRRAGGALEAVAGVNPYAYGARQADALYQGVRAPVRALFDRSVAGAWRPDVQPLGEQFTARNDALANQVERAAAVDRNAAADVLARYGVREGADQDAVYGALLQHVEGFTPEARAALLARGLSPVDADAVLDATGRFADRTRATRASELGVGAVSKDLEDVPTWVREANEQARAAGRPEPYPGDLPFPGYQRAEYGPRTLVPFGTEADAVRRRSERLSGLSQFQTGREDIFRGIPGGTATFNRWARDPRLSGAEVPGVSLTPLQARDLIARELLGGATPTLGHPVLKQAEKTAEYLRELPPEALQKGFFSTDVFGSGTARQLEGARVTASGETILEGVRRFARPVAELERQGVRYTRVPDLLGGAGLSQVDPFGTPIAQELALNALAPIHGLSTGSLGDLAQLRNLAVPEDVAADMMRIGQAWRAPASLAPVIDMWDRTVQTFKTYLTRLFPAFHVRNLMSGVFNMWRDGAASPQAGSEMMTVIRGGSLSDDVAARLYPGLSPADATRAFRDELMGQRVSFVRNTQTFDRPGVEPAIGGGMLMSDVPQVGAAAPRPLAEDVGGFLGGFVPRSGHLAEDLNPFRIGMEGRPNVAVRQADRLGNTVEDWIRGTHYLARREAGATPEAAREAVMKYQIDYSEMSQFEKNVMKRVFPWYSFSRRSLPPLLEDLAANPAKVSATMHVLTGSRPAGEFVPPWVAEGASVPIPGAPEGEQRYVSSFGLPMEDEAVKALGSALHGDYQRVFQQLFGMSQPLAKLPAELATDTQMFTGRKLEDLRPYEFATLGGLVPEDQARLATQVLANSPASRVFSTANRVADERKGTLATGASLLGLGQITDVDTERVKDVVARDLLQNLLKGQPGVRSREEVYVPADRRAGLSEQELLQLQLLNQVEQRQAKRARERARERATSPSGGQAPWR